MNKKLRAIFASPIWFLFGAIIFGIGSIRYYILEDITGMIIYGLAGILFLFGFVSRLYLTRGNNHNNS